MTRECFTCKELGVCKQTDVPKVLSHYFCPSWAPAPNEVQQARQATVSRYGEAAVAALIQPTEED